MNSVNFLKNYIPSNLTNLISSQSNRTIKTMSVALATLSFCKLQGKEVPNSIAIKYMVVLSSITFIGESFRRKNLKSFKCGNGISSHNWYGPPSIKTLEQLKNETSILKIRALMGISFLFYMICYRSTPQIKLLEIVQKNKLKWIPVIILTAPVTEEILFRGFLKERLEDVFIIFNNYIYPINKKPVELIANLVQSIVFGLIHLDGAENLAGKIVVFSSTMMLGFYFGMLSSDGNSLLEPFREHIRNNVCSASVMILPSIFKKIVWDKIKVF